MAVAHVDSSLFVKSDKGKLTTILGYEDDLIIYGDDGEEIRWGKGELISSFLDERTWLAEALS